MKARIYIPEPKRFATTADTKVLLNALIEAVNQCGATYCSHTDYHFSPHGYSAAVILSESHATLHFFPEDNTTDVTIGVTNTKKVNVEKFFSVFKHLSRREK